METCICLELIYVPQNVDEPVADAALSLAEEEARFILGGKCLNWSERFNLERAEDASRDL